MLTIHKVGDRVPWDDWEDVTITAVHHRWYGIRYDARFDDGSTVGSWDGEAN